MVLAQGAKAYQQVADRGNVRGQEADVFRRATAALRQGLERGTMDRVRAIADNRRLWLAVSDLMTDPSNGLPDPTRAGLISLSLSVRREMDKTQPDFDFLISINETIVAGLAGEP